MAAILLVGCGDLGTALAARLVAAGHRITALKRSPPAHPVPGLDYRRVDLTREAPDLAGATFEQAFVILTPGARDAAAYRALYVDGVERLVQAFAGRVGRWFFVSSTSVYGQCHGEWVDEDSATQPTTATARCLLAAERRLAGSGAPATTIRFSGIYGPGRERLLRQIAAGTAVQYDPPTYANRIHRDDCVGILELLHCRDLEGQPLAPVYLASDHCPAPLGTVARGLAGALGLPPPPPQAGNGEQNKRCRNDRIRALGYRFQYPDWRAGYLALITERSSPSFQVTP